MTLECSPLGRRTGLARAFRLATPDPPAVADCRTYYFALFLLSHEATRFVLWAWFNEDTDTGWWGSALAIGALACLTAGLWRKWTRPAATALALFLTCRIALEFPLTANHTYLEWYCLALLAFCGVRTPEERTLLLTAWCWLAFAVLFHAGIQKVLHGTYFHGEFIATQVSLRQPLGEVFAWLLPAPDADRLSALDPYQAGAGPFRLQSMLGLAASNATYILEILFALLLLYSRTRPLGVLGAVSLVAAIETAAREIFFGALVINLIVLYARHNLNRALLPFVAALYVILVATQAGWLPPWYFN